MEVIEAPEALPGFAIHRLRGSLAFRT